jgi:uncharacterized protein
LPEALVNPARDGVRVTVRVTPGANANRILGVALTAGGAKVVKVVVTAPPEAGRANEALLHLLARTWGVPRRDLAIIAGTASRRKIVRVAGDPQALAARLDGLVAGLPRV